MDELCDIAFWVLPCLIHHEGRYSFASPFCETNLVISYFFSVPMVVLLFAFFLLPRSVASFFHLVYRSFVLLSWVHLDPPRKRESEQGSGCVWDASRVVPPPIQHHAAA